MEFTIVAKTMMAGILSFGVALPAIFSVEVARSSFHWACHEWDFLYEHLHCYHHQAYKNFYAEKDIALWQQSVVRYDLPEGLATILCALSFLGFAYGVQASNSVLVGFWITLVYSFQKPLSRLLKLIASTKIMPDWIATPSQSSDIPL